MVILSVIAPLFCSKGDPPLITGRMPVISVDARLIAEEERTPVLERCAMPCVSEEKVVLPPTVNDEVSEVGLERTMLPVVLPPSVKVLFCSD